MVGDIVFLLDIQIPAISCRIPVTFEPNKQVIFRPLVPIRTDAKVSSLKIESTIKMECIFSVAE